jgi:hypothetical protein
LKPAGSIPAASSEKSVPRGVSNVLRGFLFRLKPPQPRPGELDEFVALHLALRHLG